MKGSYAIVVAILTGMAVITTGCASPVVRPTMGAPVSEFPTGLFRAVNAAFTWEFGSDGTYSSSGMHGGENGTYTVTGNEILFKGDYCGTAEGDYTWISDGSSLSFTLVNDECEVRRGIAAGGLWVKQP